MSDGYTSLHKAVVIGNLEIVKFLINHGAQLEVYNNCGISPLALA
ncbi:MAG: ankyrin repeat domain-containing protein [Wolbachia endosymbiont of Fragariocoptes setiger]|nr:ankyrin repeat domain-containing protein [Wolbachia endosymbiont of Fragariocoptes setiger]